MLRIGEKAGLFGKKSWQARWFTARKEGLTYSKKENGDAINRIKIEDITSLEFGTMNGSKKALSIVTSERVLRCLCVSEADCQVGCLKTC